MKKMISKLLVVSMLVSLSSTSYAKTSIQTWHLVDSGKHLDWDGSTAYQTQFNAAVKVWNNYKSGVIREDSVSVIQDVAISDFYEVSTTAGRTYASGAIKFNTYHMDGYSTTKKKNVCIHELGHALGLDHNEEGDIMYEYASTVTSLTSNDKESYDKSYERY